jgi:hypothetical protein
MWDFGLDTSKGASMGFFGRTLKIKDLTLDFFTGVYVTNVYACIVIIFISELKTFEEQIT